MKVAAIVPALNEEGNVGSVLKTLLDSKEINEVILVDDGSSDRTPEIGKELGAKVLILPKKGGSGKANAMKEGVKSTDAEIIVFFDADLIGLSKEHVSLVLRPVLEGKAVMCTGVRERWGGLPKFFIKIDPLFAIGGERAMEREIFEKLPPEFLRGFAVETGLNYYCRVNELPIAYAILKGLDMVVKEKKWGFWKGFKSRLRMMWQILKVRILILGKKNEFRDIQKNNS